MDIYLFSLILGFAGLAIMAFSGLASHGHDSHSHGHGHGHGGHGHDVGDVSLGGHGHHVGGHHGHDIHIGGHHGHVGHGHDVHVGHGHHGHLHAPKTFDVSPDHAHDAGDPSHDAAHPHDGGGLGKAVVSWFLSFLSPRVMFSVLVGLGAVGLLGREWLGGALLFVVALAGGVAFEKLMVSPLWNFLFRFASTPAQTLDAALMEPATAVTGFDRNGQGLVSIELDGQVVQLLATLTPEDRAAGVRVRAGDSLMVEDVDGERNRCVVSWSGAPSLPGAR